LTDIFDGFIARKAAATSNLGEKLDSAADLVMTGVVFLMLYNKINLSEEIIIWIVSIAALRFVSVITALIKYKRFVILHSYSNKASGMLLFLIPLVFSYIEAGALINIVCLVASISALEELIIHLTSKELRVNRPCIFAK
jgi:CDP-diacylglycerol--glycerol-3-phosphate 3-phosphatidyltransferase